MGKIKRQIDLGDVKRHYGIHSCLPVVIFTGRMVYRKDPDLLVEAVTRILKKRNARFVLIGDGGCALSVKIGLKTWHWEFVQFPRVCPE